jgi:hypothetical protein
VAGRNRIAVSNRKNQVAFKNELLAEVSAKWA